MKKFEELGSKLVDFNSRLDNQYPYYNFMNSFRSLIKSRIELLQSTEPYNISSTYKKFYEYIN